MRQQICNWNAKLNVSIKIPSIGSLNNHDKYDICCIYGITD